MCFIIQFRNKFIQTYQAECHIAKKTSSPYSLKLNLAEQIEKSDINWMTKIMIINRKDFGKSQSILFQCR